VGHKCHAANPRNQTAHTVAGSLILSVQPIDIIFGRILLKIKLVLIAEGRIIYREIIDERFIFQPWFNY
jgi:hypothetical protein